MNQSKQDVYCTLVTSDSYVIGARVMSHSLRQHGAKKPLVALVTAAVSDLKRKELLIHCAQVIAISTISNTGSSAANLAMMGRSELADTFSKLALWSQMQFRRIVYLDADMMVLRNLDELFEIDLVEGYVAAAPELGFPDTFNSGLMVLSPSLQLFHGLEALASKGETFDGGDQGVINMFFNKDRSANAWHRLSFMYNVEVYMRYRLNMPAIEYYRDALSVIHFIGKEKPWTLQSADAQGDGSAYSHFYREMVERWWHLAEEVRRIKPVQKSALTKEDSGVGMES